MAIAAAAAAIAGGPANLLGTLVGRARGLHRFAAGSAERSLEGSLAVLVATAAGVGALLLLTGAVGAGPGLAIAVLTGAVVAAVEALAPVAAGWLLAALVAGAYVRAALLWPPEALRQHLLAAGAAAAIAIVCRMRRYLKRDGAIAAWGVGYATWGFGGLAWFAPLLGFFLAVNWIGKLAVKVSGRRGLREEDHVEEKGSERDHVQVLANGGTCLLLAVAAAAAESLSPSLAPLLAGAYLGSLCAASADTFASELGVFSRATPVLLWTFRPVPAGESGGVTLLGYGAAAAGALLPVAVLGAVVGAGALSPRMLAGALVSGLIGSTVDSVLGATLQAKRRCPVCGRTVERREHCGAAARLQAGLPFVSNDLVNVIGALTGAILGALLLVRA
jgi:uncharacterized protein (TIGR00297 family)